MRLRIFETGFNVDDFNAFMNENIVSSSKSLENGSIHVWYKNVFEDGFQKIDKIEAIDKLIIQAESDIFINEIEKAGEETILKDKQELLARLNTNDKPEYDQVDAKINQLKIQIKMREDTIRERKTQIVTFKLLLQELLNS